MDLWFLTKTGHLFYPQQKLSELLELFRIGTHILAEEGMTGGIMHCILDVKTNMW